VYQFDCLMLALVSYYHSQQPTHLCDGLDVDVGLRQCAHHGGCNTTPVHHTLTHCRQHTAVVITVNATHTAAQQQQEQKER
jgi:hypothetical protein